MNKKELDIIKQLKNAGVKSFRIDFEWGTIFTDEVDTRYTYNVYVATLKDNVLHTIGYNSDEKIINKFITVAKRGKHIFNLKSHEILL